MGGDKPLPYKEYRRGGVYPRPHVSEYRMRLLELRIPRGAEGVDLTPPPSL